MATRIQSGVVHSGLITGGSHSFEVMGGGVCEVLVIGGAEVVVSLLGEGARCRVRGLVIEGGDIRAEVRCEVRHMAKGCSSEQLFRAVVNDSAVAHFRGMIYVAEGADGTLASQYSNGLMLTDNAQVKSDPQMEVYADDVKCNHGATVGGRDETALFYMMQRGILRSDAERLLLESFCMEVVQGVEIEGVREIIAEKLKKI